MLLCNRQEAFWGFEGAEGDDESLTNIKNILYNKRNLRSAGVAELADAQDLKTDLTKKKPLDDK